MNLSEALSITRDHIRIGKGLDFPTYEVPEALEMVVEELAATQKALELACESHANGMFGGYQITAEKLARGYLAQAKEVRDEPK